MISNAVSQPMMVPSIARAPQFGAASLGTKTIIGGLLGAGILGGYGYQFVLPSMAETANKQASALCTEVGPDKEECRVAKARANDIKSSGQTLLASLTLAGVMLGVGATGVYTRLRK